MVRATRMYGGLSADERRARRRRALLDAATDVVDELGVPGVSKRSVCAKAQLNDRYFYEHFSDSDELLEVLVAEIATDFAEATLGLLEDRRRGFREQVRSAVEAAIDFVTSTPTRTTLFISAPGPESLARARESSIRTIAEGFAAVYVDRYPGRGLGHHDTVMVAYASISGARELWAAWLAGEFDTTREHLVDVVTSVLLAIVDMAEQPSPT